MDVRMAVLWVHSAITGVEPGRDPDADAALWDAVGELAARYPFLASVWAVRATLATDGRPVASGLLATGDELERRTDGAQVRAALLALGRAVATARGPYGRSVSREDQAALDLVAELLDPTLMVS